MTLVNSLIKITLYVCACTNTIIIIIYVRLFSHLKLDFLVKIVAIILLQFYHQQGLNTMISELHYAKNKP